MNREDLEARVRQQPFRPFRLIDSAGGRYEVYRAELVLFGRTSVTLGVVDHPSQDFYESTVLIDIEHIVRLEALAAPTQAKQGGTSS